MTQGPCLGLQILPEFGQVFVHGAKHGIQCFPLHLGLLQGSVQRGFIAPELAVGDGLQLDGIEGVGHGIFNPVVTGQLRFIGIPAHLRVGRVGQIPNGGKVRGGAPIEHRHGAGQVLLKVAPCVPAGQAHFGHDRFRLSTQQIPAGFLNALEQEAVVAQFFVGFYQFHQIGQPGSPAFKGGLGRGHTAGYGHHPAKLGAGLRIFGIGRLPQRGVFPQLVAKRFDVFFQRDSLSQRMCRFGFGQRGAESGECVDFFPQRGQIGFKCRVGKAAVNRFQIPLTVHREFLLLVFQYFTRNPAESQPRAVFVKKCRIVLNTIINCRNSAFYGDRLFLFFLAKVRTSC